MKRSKLITLCALFAALCAIVSWISIPTPFLPITLQVFIVALCGFTLGAKAGFITVLIYLLLGAFGVPVFSSMQGGIGTLLSANGGFLLSFPALSFFCGLWKTRKNFYLPLLGLFICHFCGTVQFSLVTGTGLMQAVLFASLPFILKDIFLIFAARFVARKIEGLYD